MALQGFNKEYYLNAKLADLQSNPESGAEWQGADIAALENTLINDYGLTPEQHYRQFGYQEGLPPNAYFDAEEYTQAKAQSLVDGGDYTSVVEARQAFESAWQGNPYEHYLQFGAREGLDPSSDFDSSAYYEEKLLQLQSNEATANEWANRTSQDVKASFEEAGLTPLGHYMAFGQDEGLDAPSVGLTVNGDDTYFGSEDLEGYQVIRFSGINSEDTFTLEGVEGKRILVDDSDITLNLNQTASAQVVLDSSSVELWGDTVEEAGNFSPTGEMKSLSVIVEGDSSLNLSSSATYGLTNVTLTGPGSLELSGSALADNATVDASGMAGNLTVEAGMLDNAASVTAGSGNDELTVDDFTAANGNVASLSGGAGTDTLRVSSSVQVPDDANASVVAVEAGVSGFETVAFGGYSQVDAQDFQDTENFIFASGGDISNLESGQTVTVTGLSSSDSGPIIRDASGDLNIVTDFETDGETLDLGVFDEIDASGGTLSLSGNGSVEFEVAGREFDTINAEELEGGLEFTGVTYHQENVTLGTGSDTLHVTDSSIYGSDGNRMDSVTGFDAGNDTLVGIEGATQVNVESATSLEEAFNLASSDSTDGNYVAFEHSSNTYIYADTETQATNSDTGATRDTAGPSYNDFAIELTGVSVTDVMGSIA